MIPNKCRNLIDFNVIMPLAFMIFALTYYIDVMDKRYVGRLLPQICCVVMIVLLARILFVNVKKRLASDEVRDKIVDEKGRMLLIFIAMLFLYYYAILLIGYIYATLLYIPVTMFALGYRNKKVALLTTVVFVAVIYAFFVGGFNFVLPQGSLIQGL